MNKSFGVITALIISANASTAYAGDAVVPPLVTRGMDPLQTLNMTSLVASELDFLGKFSFVHQLDTTPAGLNGRCLSTESCLGNIARQNDVGAVLAGAASNKGSTIDLLLVYYDNNQIVRSKEFSVENSPSVIADTMSSFIRELVTGESTAQVQNRDTVDFEADVFSDDDVFSENEDDLFAGIAPVAVEAISRTIPTETSGAPSELDELDLDLLGDDIDEPPARTPTREPEYEPILSDPDPIQLEEEEEFNFEFASSADSVTDIEQNNTRSTRASSAYEEPEPEPVVDRYEYDEPVARETSRSSSRDYEYEDLDSDRDSRNRDSRDRDSRDRDSRDRDSRDRSSSYGEDSDRAQTRSRAIDPAVATITGRLGRSAFQTLDFVTYGIEVSVSVNEQLRFVGGIEPHSTKRDIPQLLLQEGEPSTQWNTIVPVNAGLQYSFGESMWRPYLGADVLMIPGYVTEVEGVTLEGGRTATGARARGGLDVILADGFALNLNVSYGRWNGKDFDAVQRDLADTGTVPQGSIGTVIRF
jgi:hypothetical protein